MENLTEMLKVVEGTVYTILLRLEKKKLVDIQKKPSEIGPPRKFYTLHNAGRNQLQTFWRKWDFIASKINESKENQDGVQYYFDIKKMERRKS